LKRGEIVVMMAPGDLGKPRPAVVVQADEFGEETTPVLVCPMSSEVRQSTHISPVVEPKAEDGLRITSQIMTDKMPVLRRDRIRRVLGHLDASTQDALDRALLIVGGLAN
jgi:mRNA interferase MazF